MTFEEFHNTPQGKQCRERVRQMCLEMMAYHEQWLKDNPQIAAFLEWIEQPEIQDLEVL